MSDDVSARLGLPYLAASQLQKHVTLNEALTRLDVLIQMSVASRTTEAQPAEPDDGVLYILPAGATGADWGHHPAGAVMRAEAGGWSVVPMPEGALAVVLDSDEVLVRRGSAWSAVSTGEISSVQNLTRLGVNTEADAVNIVAARLNKALWTALEAEDGGDGDLRFTFNKQGANDVLSLLFQSGWSGRAELGLIEDDDLRLKVSADGDLWREVLSVERATGRAWFAQGATRRELTVLTGNGGWTPPAWARWIEAVCVGGGGGGGAGAVAAAGAARYGGGGGGASAGAGGAGGGGLLRSNAGGDSSVSATAGVGQAQSRPDGPGGGGAGGGVSAANVAFSGGNGGDGAVLHLRASGGLGRATSGLAGQASPVPALSWAGGGGGGGGGNASGAGGPGAAGGGHGAGGGGGGAATSIAGGGGAGAAGVVWLTAIG